MGTGLLIPLQPNFKRSNLKYLAFIKITSPIRLKYMIEKFKYIPTFDTYKSMIDS